MPPDVSIVIVNWNTKPLLLSCLQSIRDTTHTILHEILVVDNASSDASCEAVMAAFPSVILNQNSTNVGFASANNIGIAVSRGRYVCLVNSDVVLLPGCLDVLTAFMDSHPSVGLVGPLVLNRDLTMQRSCSELPSLRSALMEALFLNRLFPNVSVFRGRYPSSFSQDSVKRVQVLSGCFVMARRSAVDVVGPLDERFFMYKEDVDWCKRFRDAGWDIRLVPDAQAIHFGGASSSSAPSRFFVEMQRATHQYYSKHHTWSAQRLAAAITVIHCAIRLCGWTLAFVTGYRRGSSARSMMQKYAACLHWSLFVRGNAPLER